jgi:hypothetical protein
VGTPLESVFAAFHVETRNSGTGTKSVEPSMFKVSGGNVIGAGRQDFHYEDVISIDGNPLTAEVVQGTKREGWILAELSYDAAQRAISIRPVGETATTTTESPGVILRPNGQKRPLPQLRTSVSKPSTPEAGSNAEFEISVENTGKAPGVYRGTVRTKWLEPGPYNDVKMATRKKTNIEVPAGKTRTWTPSISLPRAAPYDVNISPGAEGLSVQTTPTKLKYGTPYSVPGYPIKLSVGQPMLTDKKITIQEPGYEWTPDEGMQFAISSLTLKATNRTEWGPQGKGDSWNAYAKEMDAPSANHDDTASGNVDMLTYEQPVQGPELFDLGRYDTWNTGEEVSRYLSFEIPDSVTVEELKIQYEDQTKAAIWQS